MAGDVESPVWNSIIVSHTRFRLKLLFNNEATCLFICNVVLSIKANQNNDMLGFRRKLGPTRGVATGGARTPSGSPNTLFVAPRFRRILTLGLWCRPFHGLCTDSLIRLTSGRWPPRSNFGGDSPDRGPPGGQGTRRPVRNCRETSTQKSQFLKKIV